MPGPHRSRRRIVYASRTWACRSFEATSPPGSRTSCPRCTAASTRTLDWMLTQGGRPPNGACVMEEPRHVVLFHQGDGAVEVLNRFFACTPDDADRICRALFRAFPRTNRIHLDVMFPPADLAFPRRIRERLSHMVIDLPASVDEYYHSLGKKTRHNIRSVQEPHASGVPRHVHGDDHPG